MKKERYIVIGRYDCERNSWREHGDIRHVQSAHRKEGAAWRAAHRAHYDLGGCDGSDMLTKVMVKAPQDYTVDKHEDTYDFSGTIYTECDFWGGHEIRHDGLGLVMIPR